MHMNTTSTQVIQKAALTFCLNRDCMCLGGSSAASACDYITAMRDVVHFIIWAAVQLQCLRFQKAQLSNIPNKIYCKLDNTGQNRIMIPIL